MPCLQFLLLQRARIIERTSTSHWGVPITTPAFHPELARCLCALFLGLELQALRLSPRLTACFLQTNLHLEHLRAGSACHQCWLARLPQAGMCSRSQQSSWDTRAECRGALGCWGPADHLHHNRVSSEVQRCSGNSCLPPSSSSKSVLCYCHF